MKEDPLHLALNCLRCGHKWNAKTWNYPKKCPKCTSRYWNLPIRRNSPNKPAQDVRTYNYIKSHLFNWYVVAQLLDEIAELARPDAVKLPTEPWKPIKELRAAMPETYYMLVGFALENLYKGAIVGQIILGGGTLEDAKLDRVISKHDLVELATQAGVRLSRVSKRRLEVITECILWKGRYPIPTSARHIRDVALGSADVVHHSRPLLRQNSLQALVSQAEKNYLAVQKSLQGAGIR